MKHPLKRLLRQPASTNAQRHDSFHQLLHIHNRTDPHQNLGDERAISKERAEIVTAKFGQGVVAQ